MVIVGSSYHIFPSPLVGEANNIFKLTVLSTTWSSILGMIVLRQLVFYTDTQLFFIKGKQMLKRFMLMLCGLAFTSLLATSAYAHIDINIGISAPPPIPVGVAVVAPPSGYSRCYMTQGMWYGDVWVQPHQQCEYMGPSGPTVWVSGYYGCVSVGPGGRCGNWRWYGHRMVGRGAPPAHYGYNHYHGGPAYNHGGPEYRGGPGYHDQGRPGYHGNW